MSSPNVLVYALIHKNTETGIMTFINDVYERIQSENLFKRRLRACFIRNKKFNSHFT